MRQLSRRIARVEGRQDPAGVPCVYVVAAPYAVSEAEILRSIGACEHGWTFLLHLWEEPTPRLIA